MDVKELYEEEKLRIEVVDQGPPLDPDEQVDVFQPVMGSPGTSKRGSAAEGQGLSLYVVRLLVDIQVKQKTFFCFHQRSSFSLSWWLSSRVALLELRMW